MSEAIQTKPNRRGSDTLWFSVLDRFGLPTLLVLLFLWKGMEWVEADRKERAEILAQLSANIAAQTIVLKDMSAHDRETAEAIRALLAQRVR